MMHNAYIALGSNLANPLQQVTQAVAALHTLGTIKAVSPWYQSTAIGPGDQPDYINGVVWLETALAPLALLEALQQIENQHGRVRDIHWGARTLDLDILLFDDLTQNSERLIIPHPRMHERSFVMYPLADIAAERILPNGEKVLDVKNRLSQQGLEKLPQTR